MNPCIVDWRKRGIGTPIWAKAIMIFLSTVNSSFIFSTTIPGPK